MIVGVIVDRHRHGLGRHPKLRAQHLRALISRHPTDRRQQRLRVLVMTSRSPQGVHHHRLRSLRRAEADRLGADPDHRRVVFPGRSRPTGGDEVHRHPVARPGGLAQLNRVSERTALRHRGRGYRQRRRRLPLMAVHLQGPRIHCREASHCLQTKRPFASRILAQMARGTHHNRS